MRADVGIEKTNVCGGSTEEQLRDQVFHLYISIVILLVRPHGRQGEANVREPVGALASIASAHERVHDRVALAQVTRIARTTRANIGVAAVSQGRDRKPCLNFPRVESCKNGPRLVAHLHCYTRSASMRRRRRGFAQGCCTTGNTGVHQVWLVEIDGGDMDARTQDHDGSHEGYDT